ncbi:MAG TPA: glycosyltransferase [Aliidongia sp.]|nr:glycosyltransferase [Aliidongia sp.]
MVASFPLSVEEIEAARRAGVFFAVAGKDNPNDSRLPASYRDDPFFGYYFEPGHVRLPSGTRSIVFAGPWRRVTRRTMRDAAEQNISVLYCRVGHRWMALPTYAVFRQLWNARHGRREPGARRHRLARLPAVAAYNLLRTILSPRSFLRSLRWYWSTRLDAKPEELMQSALVDARHHGFERICLAASFPLTIAEVDEWLDHELVEGIVTKDNPDAPAVPIDRVAPGMLGFYWEPGFWQLPDSARHIYFIGSWRLVTRAMLREAVKRDVVSLSVRSGLAWWPVPLKALVMLSRFLPRSVRGGLEPLKLDPEIFHRILGGAVAPRPANAASRVVMVCGSLSPGGAERQVMYSMLGLKRKGEPVQLLCDHLTPNHPSRYDFYLPALRDAGIEVRTIRSRASGDLKRRRLDLPKSFRDCVHGLPQGLAADIANLYLEFRELKPQIVHAWLDWSNIRAGLAAVLAGVPTVIISGRNLNPSHFALYQPYMDPAYKALCRFPNVVFLNNSRAGAIDYARWLEVEPSRIQVIPNGIDFGDRKRAEPAVRAAFRVKLGVPAEAPLIGGIFRLYPEKRPLLWVEAAALVAAAHPAAHFVIYGQGILLEEIQALIEEFGLADRFHLPGVTDDVLTALSAMDVFVLTSSGEGLPNVVLEAQWVGTAVVAADAGGTREALDEGRTGWIVEEATAEAIARQISALLDEPALLQDCIERGPAFVRRQFSLERMVASTIGAYRHSPVAPIFDIDIRQEESIWEGS